MGDAGMAAATLSVVCPVFDEAACVAPLLDRLEAVLRRLGMPFEIIAVDDGSGDGTFERLVARRAALPELKVIRFSRNFGKEIALAAGLRHAGGDAVVMLDSDLQHPPELIEDFVARWRAGAQIVYGERERGREDGAARRLLTRGFYRLFEVIGEVPLMRGGGDFVLLDAAVVRVLNALPERTRFGKGLYAWVGFRRAAVPFRPAPRTDGRSRWSLWKLWVLALDAVTAFSLVPLKVSTYVGLAISAVSLSYGAWIVARTLVAGVDVPGYASLMVAIAFFGGIQLVTLGVIGEYLGRVFTEVKRRPLYVIERAEGFGPDGLPPFGAAGP